jgi:hypothetical protein
VPVLPFVLVEFSDNPISQLPASWPFSEAQVVKRERPVVRHLQSSPESRERLILPDSRHSPGIFLTPIYHRANESQQTQQCSAGTLSNSFELGDDSQYLGVLALA